MYQATYSTTVAGEYLIHINTGESKYLRSFHSPVLPLFTAATANAFVTMLALGFIKE